MLLTRRSLLTGTGSLALAGCVAPRPMAPLPWWAPHVTVDPVLEARGLRDLDVNRGMTAGEFVRISATWRNVSQTGRLSVLARFTWFDAAGQPVETLLSAWEAVHAPPGTWASVDGTAPRADIAAFRLELIHADGS